jgi:DNA polymerase-3 subunit gamma/tau
MPFHVDYRPETIDDIWGNDAIKTSLKTALKRSKKPHSFIFTGEPGCGKTTFARAVKNELGISDINFYEYNVANVRGIDTIRKIRDESEVYGLDGRNKMYLLDEFHRMTPDAMNALLKLLEEPPNHVFIALCTAEIETVKQTIRKALLRRCHQYECKPLRSNELMKLMKSIIRSEEGDVKYYLKVLLKISEVSNGSPGQALKLLDECYDMKVDTALSLIEDIYVNEASIIELCRLLLDTRLTNESKWPKIQQAVTDIKGDPEQIRYAILSYINKVMLGNNWSDHAATVGAYFTESFMYSGKAALTLACYMICFGEVKDDLPF